MMYDPMTRVKEFHDAFGVEREHTTEDKENLVSLRRVLIEEETKEAAVELNRLARRVERSQHGRSARVALAKELADLLYVTYGTAEVLGIPLTDVFEEVHRSNMSKLGLDGRPVRRSDGKVLKGPNYTEADVDKILFQ
ncbi:MazG nucleotide pyrophosphohydrolase domain-containing protein [Streptomyces sp. H27-C3]|uniref:MazG nucleotide pyrophosphohydrolase domain-containing protein n=1 Tax=Streptomyces sp. H27-C3 TaxID=3046305 RepID=UPI0024B99984|nr:MazG nucleotide pyrophosphohydrolase domain-containing protein [Streptomyces sp. H27-C3]MDJ0463103.1 MazG nucleotide pyrophosphohydrolase domain-containing protein [Streptomyces sp. H27-C3]